jgi:hypothetical protein
MNDSNNSSASSENELTFGASHSNNLVIGTRMSVQVVSAVAFSRSLIPRDVETLLERREADISNSLVRYLER